MSGEPSTDAFVSVEFLELIVRHKAETDSLDHKRAMEWDDGDTSAKLAKDIMAFANSKGGGWIVIGVEEPSRGDFQLVGVPEAHAATFETTRLAKWVNARCDPPVVLRVYKPTVESKLFVVIRVLEFEETPIMCTREHPIGNKLELKTGAIYARNQNAECVSISKGSELRTLIGLATRKQSQTLLAQIQGVLLSGRIVKGDPVEIAPENDRKNIVQFLEDRVGPLAARGFEWCSVVPLENVEPLFSDRNSGEQLLRSFVTRCNGATVPLDIRNVSGQMWGVGNSDSSFGYGLSHHGVFIERSLRISEEAHGGVVAEYQMLGRAFGDKGEFGRHVHYQGEIYETVCRFRLMSKLASRFPPTTPIRVSFGLTQLRGRRLVSMDPRVRLFPTPACQALEFDWSKDDAAGSFESMWKECCADALTRLFDILNADIQRTTVMEWVNSSSNELH